MCILFSYLSKRSIPGKFKLIILNNRDEHFHRPSKMASFVNKTSIYATDQTIGKEGGTWLGSNKYGKICCLLNLDPIDYNGNDSQKAGRGFLVPDFLNSNRNIDEYITNIRPNSHNYNPFNLLLFEKNQKDLYDIAVFENFNKTFEKINKEFVTISNHLFEKPFIKTNVGEEIFKNIIDNYNDVSQKEILINKLLELAKYDAGKKFEQSMSEAEIRNLVREQVFIDIPGYGTRTNTIIIIDDTNRVTYIENNLNLPLELENSQWEKSVIEFELNQNI